MLASPRAIRKVNPVKHHAALPYEALPAFMNDLKEREGTAAAAMKFLILTTTRTSETLEPLD